MSYDIMLLDPVTKQTIEFDFKHHYRGGTYELGGSCSASLNVTYNYGGIFRELFGEKGIRHIYGMTGAQAIPVLKTAIARLGDDADDDYWKPTEGNVKQALSGLLAFAELRPDGIFDGD